MHLQSLIEHRVFLFIWSCKSQLTPSKAWENVFDLRTLYLNLQ